MAQARRRAMPYFLAYRHDVIFLLAQEWPHIISEQRAAHLIVRYVRSGLVPGVSVQERDRAGFADNRHSWIFAVGPWIVAQLMRSRHVARAAVLFGEVVDH